MTFRINKSKVLRFLFTCVALLLIGNILSIFLLMKYTNTSIEGSLYNKIMILFNFNIEANLPTYFSALVLLGNAILLAVIARGNKHLERKYWHWIGLAIVFCVLSLDEMITIHEHLIMPTEKLLNTSGYFKYAWIIPYGILTVLLGIAYAKFMFRLPKRILRLFILAAVLFISGALVMEAISGNYDENYGIQNLGSYLMYTIEELLEMSGAIVFLYALISYIEIKFKTLQFNFGSKEA